MPRRSLAAAVLVALVGAGAWLTPATPVTALDGNDWLGAVNTYRAMSGLAPVAAEGAWAGGAGAHSCYMLANGITHDEVPGNPRYTAEGDAAGNAGNVAVAGDSWTPRQFVDLWMTGPFHALGILRPTLARSAYGGCTAGGRGAATLDVIRGIDWGRSASYPIVFPGNGATVPLARFVAESPDPRTFCGWGGETVGLPLIAMFPATATSAGATLHGPTGPIETCVLTAGNTSGTAQQLLAADRAVVVLPRTPLANGGYTASVSSSGGSANWSFAVDTTIPLGAGPAPVLRDTTATAAPAGFVPDAPRRIVDTRVGQGAGRLAAGTVTRIRVPNPDATAVSANFVAVGAAAAGFLTAYNCTAAVPEVATVNYGPGAAVANQATVPLDGGDVCLFTSADTDVVIDVNGVYRTSSNVGFVAVTPTRVFDSRDAGALTAGAEQRISVAGPGAGVKAVALNVTVVDPTGPGFAQVYACATGSGTFATLNYLAGETRPNSAIVPVDGNGEICFQTSTDSHFVIDLTGRFAAGQGARLQPLAPIRVLDTRSPYASLNPLTRGQRATAGQVLRIDLAGVRGIPAGAKAVSVNLAAANPAAGTYLTAYPCGSLPSTASVTVDPWQGAASNGALVKLSVDGDLCIFTLSATDVIVDVNGIY